MDDPLLVAVEACDIKRILELLTGGADPNVADSKGETALMRAVTMAEPSMVLQLLRHGADPNARRSDGEGPVSLAARVHAPLVISSLTQHAVEEREPCIRLLARHGADLSWQGPQAAYHGITWAALGTMEALDDAGLDWDAPVAPDNPNAPRLIDQLLFMAVSTSVPMPPIIRFCLEKGAHVNKVMGKGFTPLLVYISRNHSDPEVIRIFIDAGADLDQQTYAGTTALMYAAGRGHLNTVATLLEAGANPAVHDVMGRTFIHRAAESGIVDVLKLALAAGIRPEQPIRPTKTDTIRTSFSEMGAGDFLVLVPNRGFLLLEACTKDQAEAMTVIQKKWGHARPKQGPFSIVEVVDTGREPARPANPWAFSMPIEAAPDDLLVLAHVATVPPRKEDKPQVRCAIVGHYPTADTMTASIRANHLPGRALVVRLKEVITMEDGWGTNWAGLVGSEAGFKEVG